MSLWGILYGSVQRCRGPGLEGQLVWPEGHHWFLPHSSETLFTCPLQLGASFSVTPMEGWSSGTGWASCCGNLTPFSEGPRLPKRQKSQHKLLPYPTVLPNTFNPPTPIFLPLCPQQYPSPPPLPVPGSAAGLFGAPAGPVV